MPTPHVGRFSRPCTPLVFLLAFVSIVPLVFSGCVGGRYGSRGDSGTPTTVTTGARRADPGYLQYLERLSMLGSQPELARVVSGSQLAWLRAGDSPMPEPLLVLSNTWLRINPLMMMPETKRSGFATIASPIFWQILNKSRINGLYMAPTSGSGALWAYDRKVSPRGDDVIQYTFSEAAGKEEEYFRLLNAANTNRKLLGLEMTPATTGLGPDFFLAARNYRQFPGTYCLVELPQQVWNELPAVANEWSGEALSPAQVARLAGLNILPDTIAQDTYTSGLKTGWAVTGEIHGVDGLMRRWAYRYNGAADRPVLNWEDPSASARKVMSGSAIRNVGMLGGALVGIRLDGLYGLDALPAGKAGKTAKTLSPADEAAVSISREIRRYGGWSWLQDELPLSLIETLMRNGPDFFQDPVFSPGIEHALLTGSTGLLDAMTDDALALGIDMRRFVHAMPGDTGISYAMPHLAERALGLGKKGVLTSRVAEEFRKNTQLEMQNATLSANMQAPHGTDVAPLADKRLHTTSAGLVALALGVGNAASVTDDMLPQMRDGHLMMVFFRAMLPGLLMLSGQDIAGTLPLSWHGMVDRPEDWDVTMTARGAYALTQGTDSATVTAQGVGKAKTIYPTADVQLMTDDSFIAHIARILAIRSNLNVANGKVHGRFVTYSPSTFALAVLLPGGKQGETAAAPTSGEAASGASSADPASPDLFLEARSDRKPTATERARMEREEEERLRGQLQKQIIATPQPASGFTPGDSALITVYNFSRDPITETIDISISPTLSRIRAKGAPVLISPDAIWGALKKSGGGSKENAAKVTMSHGQKTITVNLPPWRAAAILIGKSPL